MTDFSQTPSYADHYTPPVQGDADAQHSQQSQAPQSAQPAQNSQAPQTSQVSQALEDQNIFFLLGIENATDDEKEEFLDELQQVIWEDFLDNDVELLLTEEEMVDFKKISDKQGVEEEERQVQMIEFLEKLIPDLEKIMLEKALELKEQMMRERLAQLLDENEENPEMLAKVKHAQSLVDDQQWRLAAEELNAFQTYKIH